MNVFDERKIKIAYDIASVDKVIQANKRDVKKVQATLKQIRATKLAALEEEMKIIEFQHGLPKLLIVGASLQGERNRLARELANCKKIVINVNDLNKVWKKFDEKIGCKKYGLYYYGRPEIAFGQGKEFLSMHDIESMKKVMQAGHFQDDVLLGKIWLYSEDHGGEEVYHYDGPTFPEFHLPVVVHLNAPVKLKEGWDDCGSIIKRGETKHYYDFIGEFDYHDARCYGGKETTYVRVDSEISFCDYQIEIDLACLDNIQGRDRSKEGKELFEARKIMLLEAFAEVLEEEKIASTNKNNNDEDE